MWTFAAVLVLSVAWPAQASAATPGPAPRRQAVAQRPALRTLDADAERRAVAAALELVPRRSAYEVVIIDPDHVADAAAIRRLDAFTVREPDGRLRPTVYLNRESSLLREAAGGVDFSLKALAAVIVHEIAHLDGGSEQTARAAERRFFEDLVARGLVAQLDGMRYLSLLGER
jgi:hypothetical protein